MSFLNKHYLLTYLHDTPGTSKCPQYTIPVYAPGTSKKKSSPSTLTLILYNTMSDIFRILNK